MSGSSSTVQSCVVCRDYTQIDAFARSNRLQILKSAPSGPIRETLNTIQTCHDQLLALVSQAKSSKVPNDVSLLNYQKALQDEVQLWGAQVTHQEDILSLTNQNDPDRPTVIGQLAAARSSYQNAEDKWLEAMAPVAINSTATPDNVIRSKAAQAVKVLASQIWASAMADGCVKANDYTGFARLLFLWIPLSIKWVSNIRDADNWAQRSPATTIVTEIEVCRGFSELFEIMFNTVISANPDPNINKLRAVRISGFYKSGTKKVPSEQGANGMHAWNAFPMILAGGHVQMKLIDCTRAVEGRNGDELNTSWFTRSNQSFNILDWPDEATRPDPYAGQVFPPPKDFCANIPATFFSEKYVSSWVDQSSLKPPQYTIDGSTATQRFEFRPACPHIVLQRPLPCFVLAIGQTSTISSAKGIYTFQLNQDQTAWMTEASFAGYPKDGSVEVSVRVPTTIPAGKAIFVPDANDLIPLAGDIFWEAIAQWRLGTPPPPNPLKDGVLKLVGGIFRLDKGKK